MTDLDIVIVNWNTGQQLRDCLQSILLACSGSLFRLRLCAVIDNASSDGSADGLEKLPLPLTVIRNEENTGFACACNQGAKLGTAEYVLFLNPDARLFPESLTRALLFLQDARHEKVGILGIQLLDSGGTVQRNTGRFPTPKSLFYQMVGLDRLWPGRFPPHIMTDWDHRESREVDQVQGAFYLVRRMVFEALNGFDERFFIYFEDVDFSYRARRAGWTSYYLADSQAFHFGGGSFSRGKARQLAYVLGSRVRYAAKHFGPPTGRAILFFSLGVELWIRLGWSLTSFSGQSFFETLQAYGMFMKTLPKLLKDLKA